MNVPSFKSTAVISYGRTRFGVAGSYANSRESAILLLNYGRDQMRETLKKQQTGSERRHIAKGERLMASEEAAALLESAKEALSMVRGSELVGSRNVVREGSPRSRSGKRK